MEKHKNSHLEGELVKLRKSSVEIVSPPSSERMEGRQTDRSSPRGHGCVCPLPMVSYPESVCRIWRTINIDRKGTAKTGKDDDRPRLSPSPTPGRPLQARMNLFSYLTPFGFKCSFYVWYASVVFCG